MITSHVDFDMITAQVIIRMMTAQVHIQCIKSIYKNVGHDMAIVGEPCNGDAHANIPYLFMTK